MLAEIGFETFKSYRSARLPLAPLTLLIGANASGKSNAIEGLRLLSWLAQDHKLSSIRYDIQESDDIVRGTVADLPYRGEQKLKFTCRLDPFPFNISFEEWEWGILSLTIEHQDNELRIIDESIIRPEKKVPLYKVDAPASPPSHDMKVAYDNFARGGIKPRITCSDQQAVFLQLQSAARFEYGHTQAQRIIPKVAATYQNLLADILFLDPVPSRMRGYSFPGDKRLLGDGRNISGIMHELWHSEHNRQKILSFIASLPEQDIVDLGFASTSRNEVMVRLFETFGGRRTAIDAPSLSDGTLRVLAVAVALLSAPEGSMVVVEEIDNGVHPNRADLLLKNIREIAQQRRLRVLLATHNPALMDALPDEALQDVVFCYRDPEIGDSRLVRLADLERAPSLLAQGSLGDLVTRGVLDRFVKDRTSQEERQHKNKAWLAGIEQLAS